MGLTGALLLITGLVYAVIGIKNKWYVRPPYTDDYLQSTSNVSVMINHDLMLALEDDSVTNTCTNFDQDLFYLMNPPVSDGVQGAFFVAAFFTGLIFGVLSLVFSDITEGFGCLLGGFCLSMWFLSLKSGGLISSSTGRAIFIGCMSAGGYSLSFSHYTRNYGLIASISFSGATAAILGIDCLARAGLKEFWLYLWSLNDDIFPLNTNTYPLTKNIKAELAGIVIISVFGVVSQLRVWNMVKERREKSAQQELEKQEENDREEEAQGRLVEDKFQKERAQWEAAYGNKSIPDSSVRSSSIASPKASSSIREKEVYGKDSVEMASLPKSGPAAESTTVTINVLPDDDIQQLDAQGNPITYRSLPRGPTATSPEFTAPPTKERSVTKRTSLQAAVPPPPVVVPLPFNIPTESDARSEDEDNSSVSAVPETHYEAAADQRPMSKRISDMSAARGFSMHRGSHVFSESSEALVDNDVEDDRASSIAATLDDHNDGVSVRHISPPQSPIGTEHNMPSEDVTESTDAQADDLADKRPAFRQSLTTSTDPRSDEERTKRSSFRDSRMRADTLMASNKSGSEQSAQSKSSDSDMQSQTGHAESQIGSLKDAPMPARLSKVALSYRTNEWAKHLEAAEKPDLDELPSPVLPGAISEEVSEERAVPVSDEIAAPLMERAPSVIASSGVLSRSNSSARIDVLAPLPSNTLLGQRETLMRKRTSSQSITPGSSATNLLELADQENMSLAQRRQMLQNHQSTAPTLQHQSSITSPRRSPPSTSQKWQNKSWATKGAPTGFDSHQPKRTSSSQSDKKREELYAGWRDNIRDVTPPQTQAHLIEQQRAALLNERRQKELEKQQRESIQQQRASMLDSMMRSGHMMDAHREAMRKMQANAARNAS
ncbi:hypothetical protein SNOG_09353 [Parastagonospora nodorum SN15]|uniref:TM7S3/TM198-like domain-containing protein n=1 Tax=Phaeosphaeria nodorum (strain SN15 / ATCC MYA-4574 / FGSC 10173) TaxID=321614 RepID=Q0UFW1_PHANO|nr:hypothetical protein SNOG_09353 [Parastagonospora nodorum SN15]EAT83545.2 hypothetical protein SNOG_09353 [Parastagonospora nodorum SN15]